MKVYLVIGYLLFSLSAWSQVDFDAATQWSGTIDGIHPIELTLKEENKETTGRLTLVNSGKTFLLEGKKEGHGWVLDEIDENYKISGQLNLTFSDKKIDGIWSNHLGNIFLRVQLVPSEESLPAFECSQENWTKTYVGVFEQSNLKTIVRKENNSQVYMEVYFDEIPIEGKLTCLSETCKTFSFTSKQLKHLFNSLEFSITNKNELLTFVKRSDKRTQVKMVKQAGIEYTCNSYADYSSRIDIVIPKTSNKAYNRFLQNSIQKFRSKQNQITKDQNRIETPQSRFFVTSSIWTDIHYFSSRYISGTITDQNNIANQNERIAFIFDLKENKLIEPSSLFKKKKNYDKTIESFLLEQKTFYVSLNEKYIKDWAQKEKFQHVTISKNGFLFNSNFHNVYGERQLVMPFNTVKNQLKKDFKKEMKIR